LTIGTTLSIALFVTFASIGCAGQGGGERPAAAADPAGALGGPRVSATASSDLVPVVNAWCPIIPENPVSSTKSTTRSLTRTWRGQRIGFCCEACPPTWDDMSDEDRSAALARAIGRENQVGLPDAGRMR
jgi:hypothetical protein